MSRILETPNLVLGSALNPTFLEISDNWTTDDLIVLHSLGITPPQGDEWIRNHLLLSGQNLANKILSQLIEEQKILPKQTSTIITIRRIF